MLTNQLRVKEQENRQTHDHHVGTEQEQNAGLIKGPSILHAADRLHHRARSRQHRHNLPARRVQLVDVWKPSQAQASRKGDQRQQNATDNRRPFQAEKRCAWEHDLFIIARLIGNTASPVPEESQSQEKTCGPSTRFPPSPLRLTTRRRRSPGSPRCSVLKRRSISRATASGGSPSPRRSRLRWNFCWLPGFPTLWVRTRRGCFPPAIARAATRS